jgi:hypothetical protein
MDQGHHCKSSVCTYELNFGSGAQVQYQLSYYHNKTSHAGSERMTLVTLRVVIEKRANDSVLIIHDTEWLKYKLWS